MPVNSLNQIFTIRPVGSGTGGGSGVGSTADTQVLFNDAGVLAGNAAFTFTKGTGNLTSTKYNGMTITGSTGTFTLANAKTLTVSNTLTITSTDGSTASFGAGGTVAYTSNKLSAFAATTSAELAGVISDETGSGALVFAASPTLVTPILGTPTSGTLTNATGLPITTGVSGLGTNVATFLATPSSANLAAAMTDETGSGASVFATSPTLVTPLLGTPTSGTLTNCTGLPEAGLTLADNATANASTSAHGFLKKLDNNAAHFMDGTGAWTTPTGGAASPLTTKGDVWVYTSTDARLAVGTSAPIAGTTGFILTADSSKTTGLNYVVPQRCMPYSFESCMDFLGNGAATDFTTAGNGSGTGSGASYQGWSGSGTDGTRMGNVQLSTGTTTTGNYYYYYPNNSSLSIGSGAFIFETDINLSALSNGTDTYTFYSGIVGSPTATAPTTNGYGAFFSYTDSANSGKWNCGTVYGSTLTTTNTSTAVAATTWTRLTIILDATLSNFYFYVNGTLVATNTTNLLQAAGGGWYVIAAIKKSAGTTASTCALDYMYVRKEFTTAR